MHVCLFDILWNNETNNLMLEFTSPLGQQAQQDQTRKKRDILFQKEVQRRAIRRIRKQNEAAA